MLETVKALGESFLEWFKDGGYYKDEHRVVIDLKSSKDLYSTVALWNQLENILRRKRKIPYETVSEILRHQRCLKRRIIRFVAEMHPDITYRDLSRLQYHELATRIENLE